MVRATALKVVFDLLHVYGFDAFSITPHSDTGATGEEEQEVSIIIYYKPQRVTNTNYCHLGLYF